MFSAIASMFGGGGGGDSGGGGMSQNAEATSGATGGTAASGSTGSMIYNNSKGVPGWVVAVAAVALLILCQSIRTHTLRHALARALAELDGWRLTEVIMRKTLA